MYPVAVASSSVAARVSIASYGVKLKVWLKLFDSRINLPGTFFSSIELDKEKGAPAARPEEGKVGRRKSGGESSAATCRRRPVSTPAQVPSARHPPRPHSSA